MRVEIKALLLGKRGVKMQEERVWVRAKVSYNEGNSLRHEAADEMNVARQAIELGDDDGGTRKLGLRQRSGC